ncbi:MAG: GNAT family N-acetyltransferase [Patescibacteria group bacterium]
MDSKQKPVPGFPGRWIKLVLGENVEVGVAYLAGQVFENDLYGYLLDFKIMEEYRRRGAGKKLMAAVKSAAKREGCKRVAVMMPHEEPFSGWLQYVGFAKVGEALVMEI